MKRNRPSLGADFSNHVFRILVFISAATVVLSLVGIIFFIVRESLPAMQNLGFSLFESDWYPTHWDASYGIGIMLVNTIFIAAFAGGLVWIVGMVIALYLKEYARPKEREGIIRIIEYLTGIPSVVFGFFGIVIMAQWLLNAGAWTGLNFLNASIMLFLLTLPIMVSLTYQSLESVPVEIREGAIAMGSKPLGVMAMSIRVAFPGILNAAIISFNRIVGETMIVLMVSGGSNLVPQSFFDPFRPLTVALGSEMGEVELRSLHYSTLFLIGFVLLVFSFGLTQLSAEIAKRGERWLKR